MLTIEQIRTIEALKNACERQSGQSDTYTVQDTGVSYLWRREGMTPDGLAHGSVLFIRNGRTNVEPFQVTPGGRIIASVPMPVEWTDPALRIAELRAHLFYIAADGQDAADMGEDADLWAEYDILTGR